jgi:two-component system, NarL family, response regulator DesR
VIRVLLAEDQAMVRGALATLLGLEEDLDVVAAVGSGTEVLPAATATRPEVAVLDIDMPGKNGLDAMRELRAKLPNCRVVIVTTFGRPGYLRRAVEAGADGFLVKDGPAEQLATAIRRVAAGHQMIDPELAAAALRMGPNPLSQREQDVLARAADGSPIAEIARVLFLSESTVRNYLSSSIQKLGARNRMEAVQLAQQSGWL